MFRGRSIPSTILSAFRGSPRRSAPDERVDAATRASLETRIAQLEREVFRLRDLSGRLLTAHDDERRRIARNLHDNLSQQLALLAIGLQELGLHLPATPDGTASPVDDLWRQTVEISSDVHKLSQKLHPSKLDTLGLVTTMRAHCRDASRHGVRIHFSDRDVPAGIPPEVGLSLFRILEESVANVIQHSAAAEAHVTLQGEDGGLVLRIADEGRGFEPGGAGQPPGLGLVSMPARLHGLGGTVTVVSTTGGGGTIVEARVPGIGAGVPSVPSEPRDDAASASFAPQDGAGSLDPAAGSFRPRVH